MTGLSPKTLFEAYAKARIDIIAGEEREVSFPWLVTFIGRRKRQKETFRKALMEKLDENLP